MPNLLLDGLQLMIVGMGFVYVFLIVMIFCMTLMRFILAPLAAKLEKTAATAASAAGSPDDSNIAAVAAAAVEAFRRG